MVDSAAPSRPPGTAPLRLFLIGALAAAVVAIGLGTLLIVDRGDGSPPTDRRSALASAVSHARAASAPFAGLHEVHLGVGGRCLRVAVAQTLTERVAGLRGTTDLGSYGGMLFVFEGDNSAAFTMAGVTVPLDIGFYRPDGARDSSRMMKPCARAEADCPVYRADGPYLYALETPGGQLPPGPITTC
jgi:uncharacterized membrane protein (UPF0127 family)